MSTDDKWSQMFADSVTAAYEAVGMPDPKTRAERIEEYLAHCSCARCDDSGEVWDGHTREHDTGMPVTAPCPDCSLYTTRTRP